MSCLNVFDHFVGLALKGLTLITNVQMLEILIDHKFQWPQEGLNFEPLTCNAVTKPTIELANCIACKKFAIQILLWSLEFAIYQNLEHNTIAASHLARSISTKAQILLECPALQTHRINLSSINLEKIIFVLKRNISKRFHFKKFSYPFAMPQKTL